MNGVFPHSCEYCQRYYPKNDINHAMKGGGECWIWNSLKGGDRRPNDCENHVPLDEATLLRHQMYAVRMVPIENGFSFSLTDTYLHVPLICLECGSLDEGIAKMSKAIDDWLAYFEKCVKCLSCAKKVFGVGGVYSKPENDTVGNVQSNARKRMNTIMRGFPRNIQLSHRFFCGNAHKLVTLRIFNVKGNPVMKICDGNIPYMTVDEYCQNPVNKGMVNLILAEFVGYYKFIALLKKDIAKHVH
jgi:hypothetical protein